MKYYTTTKKSKMSKKSKKSKKNARTQSRNRKRIKIMKGGTTDTTSPITAVGSAWKAEDMNTWLGSNHLPLNPYGASPSPAGINTRDLLFGGGMKKPKKGILRLKGNKKGGKRKTKKIRFVKNKNTNTRRSEIKIKKGGSAFIPDDISNLKDSLIGGLRSTFNGYKGVATPYQVNHTYPYQQPSFNETNPYNISDANAMYNNADNVVISKY